MAFPKPNFTQTPNLFFDDSLPKIKSFAELKVVLAVVRQTFGWRKESDKLSHSQLANLTGLTRRGVINGVNMALEHGFLEREASGQTFIYRLALVNSVHQSEQVASEQDSPELVNESDTQLVNQVHTQKKGSKEKKEKSVGAHTAGNGKKRDGLLDNPFVVAYRDVCHLTPNAEQRQLIASTVTDQGLWDSVLRKFMREGQRPQRVDWLLERYVAGNGNGAGRPVWMASAK